MDYQIIEKETFTVLERVESHSVLNQENAKSIPDFWTRAHRDGTVRKLLELTIDRTSIFGICYGGLPENAQTFEYSIAAICGEDAVVPDGFRKNTIPAGTWAVFDCTGAMPDAIQEMWHRICTEFFPTSGYQPTYALDIEAYTEGVMSSPDYRSAIWVPVTKKESQ